MGTTHSRERSSAAVSSRAAPPGERLRGAESTGVVDNRCAWPEFREDTLSPARIARCTRVKTVPVPQTILTRKTKHALFLVLTINAGGEDAVRGMFDVLGSRINSVSSRAPEQALAGIVSIGSDAWDRLFAGNRPKSLRPFVEYAGDVHTAPATPGDLLLHLKADAMDLCYELGRMLMSELGDAVTVVD